ncbi:MAG: hypothetical protein QM278_05735 [Pseudomonadota bacterium]|nr:hypothetical protein [Pseudomonadota bacterium]
MEAQGIPELLLGILGHDRRGVSGGGVALYDEATEIATLREFSQSAEPASHPPLNAVEGRGPKEIGDDDHYQNKRDI